MINDALRLIRKFNEYSAKELAGELKISPSYLSEIETGKKTPNLELINKYSELFDMKASTILFFSEEIDKNGNDKKQKGHAKRILIKLMKNYQNF